MDVQHKRGHSALRKGRVSIQGQIYLVTASTHERRPWFADFQCAMLAARSFDKACSGSDAKLVAWVLMPDHAHWLLRLGDGQLSSTVNVLKSGSGRAVNKLCERSGAVWDNGFHDHALRYDENIKQAARYIIANPVRAKLVTQVGNYPFWNSIWL